MKIVLLLLTIILTSCTPDPPHIKELIAIRERPLRSYQSLKNCYQAVMENNGDDAGFNLACKSPYKNQESPYGK